jgi:hypothetical protein
MSSDRGQSADKGGQMVELKGEKLERGWDLRRYRSMNTNSAQNCSRLEHRAGTC